MRHLLVFLSCALLLVACVTIGVIRSDQGFPTPASVTSTPLGPGATLEPATPESPTFAATDTISPLPPNATTFPDPAAYQWAPVVTGLDRPVDIQNAGDGSGRLFVVERPGRIRVVENGRLLAAPFLDIGDRVGSDGSERGLLGFAFHPHYHENGYFFVNYTNKDGNTVIARFKVSADPDRADSGSGVKLLEVDQPYANHNGGVVAFGSDGYLYLGLGDGGSGGDPHGNGQSTKTLLGKILRIDVDHGEPYTVPPENPFVNGGGRPEVWAYGLRNPWRFSFDRLNGEMYIGDVGQNQWEEIDFIQAGTSGGVNFGWNYFEGDHPYSGQPAAQLDLTWPVAEYSHADGCAVTGGIVYRGAQLPAWNGIYIYGDYCSGLIWGLLRSGTNWQSQVLFRSGFNITTFGQDESGEAYLSDYNSGTIYRLSPQ
jgi:glucose/arabinose dehydrogenase